MKVKLLKSIFFLFFVLQSTNLLDLKHEKRNRFGVKKFGRAEIPVRDDFNIIRAIDNDTRNWFRGKFVELMKEIDMPMDSKTTFAFDETVIAVGGRNRDIFVQGTNFAFGKNGKVAVQSEMATLRIVNNFAFSHHLCGFIPVGNVGYALFLPRPKELLVRIIERSYKEHTKSKGFISLSNVKGFIGLSRTIVKESYNLKFVPKLEQVIQMALALEEFHGTGLIHNLINIESYFVMDDGRIVLSQFQYAVVANNTYFNGVLGKTGYVPYDAQVVEEKPSMFSKFIPKIYLTQKLDTFALGITILNLIVPQFYRCLHTEDKCKFKYFDLRIKELTPKLFENIQEFRAFLNKKVARKISKIQKQLENLIFDRLLVEREKRLTSSEFVDELENIAGNMLIIKIRDKFMQDNHSQCPDLSYIPLKTDVPEEFEPIRFTGINYFPRSH